MADPVFDITRRQLPDPQACGASCSCGDYVCCLPADHDDRHQCCADGLPEGPTLASWFDDQSDDEPYACTHQEQEHLLTLSVGVELVRCTHCGDLSKQVDDPAGPVMLTTMNPRSDRRIRYEQVRPGAGQDVPHNGGSGDTA